MGVILDPLAGGDRGGIADHGDQLAMAARPEPQHAEEPFPALWRAPLAMEGARTSPGPWLATDHPCEEAETSSDQLLNQTDFALRWGMSPRTLENWRWKGDGPPFLEVGHKVLYRLEDIEAYEKQSVRTTSARIPTNSPSPPG